MSTTTLSSKLKDYFASLTATNAICSAVGTTLSFGTNLFINFEPEATSCISIIQYGGSSPRNDRYKYQSEFQVRVKNLSRSKGEEISQAIINELHYNRSAISKGFILSKNSSPILLYIRDGGEKFVFVSNFTAKYVKF